MMQESRLACLQAYRKDKSRIILSYRGIILDACREVAIRNRTIKIPDMWIRSYWVKENSEDGEIPMIQGFHCASIEYYKENEQEDRLGVTSFDESLLLLLSIQSAMAKASPRAIEVLDLLLEGYSAMDISIKLGIARSAVYAHMDRIRRKLKEEGICQ